MARRYSMSMRALRCGILPVDMSLRSHAALTSRLVLALVALAPAPALAFSTQGYKWTNQAGDPVSFRLQPDGAPGVGAEDLDVIRRAFRSWEGVACSYLRFREDPWQEPRTVANDGFNRIFWSRAEAEWPADQRATIALTYTFYRTADRAIVDADIFSNAVTYQWTATDGASGGTTVDLETVLFHEIGHFFGLDHSQDPGAAMFPSNNKPQQRGPATDDINAICALYGNGQAVPGNPAGGAAVGSPCRGNEDCAGRLCIEDPALNLTYCSQQCTGANASSCPIGYECAATSLGDLCVAPTPADELCDQCSSGQQCASGLCLNVPGKNGFQPFCTRACDPTPGAAGQCPAGYECGVVFDQGLQGGVCAPTAGICNPKGKGGHGEPCFSNGTCKPQHLCTPFYPGTTSPTFCYYECPTSAVGRSCSDSLPVQCVALDGDLVNRAVCVEVAEVGRPCAPESCRSDAICAWKENESFDQALCYQLCDGTHPCPQNSLCVEDGSLGTGVGYCQPNAGFLQLGAGCQSDTECESRSCKTYGSTRLCTQPCVETDMTSCPVGLVCVPNPATRQGFCWPRSILENGAVDPTRNVTSREIPGFCACDTTNACDSGCECDPECAGGACSCATTSAEAGGAEAWLVGLGLVLAVGLIRRRYSTRSSNILR